MDRANNLRRILVLVLLNLPTPAWLLGFLFLSVGAVAIFTVQKRSLQANRAELRWLLSRFTVA